MVIKDKIKADSVQALKNGDKARVEVLRYLISLIDKKEMQLPVGGMREEDVVAVLKKELKNKEEAREMFAQANRLDLVASQDEEIMIVREYLPPELEESEIARVVDESVAQVGENFGLVMKTVMQKLAGQAGGDIVSRLVKQRLSEKTS
jgi:hypothetical protein